MGKRVVEQQDTRLLAHFFRHELDLSLYDNGASLISVLSEYSTNAILSFVQSIFSPFDLKKSDIPQFSDVNDCFDAVPNIIVNSGKDGISFQDMGFILRQSKRKIGADRKYGENHMKTCAQLGLCSIHDSKAYPNGLTAIFNGLSNQTKKILRPKFCLYNTLVQSYFGIGASEDILLMLTSILAESTQKRRLSNCRTLIGIVENALLHEF